LIDFLLKFYYYTIVNNLKGGYVMRIRKQKNLTYNMVWATTVFAGVVTLAGAAYGVDIAERIIGQLNGEKQALQGQLSAQQTEARSLKAELIKAVEAKKSLEQEQAELKEMTGGSGSNTPIPNRLNKLREKVNMVDSAEKKLGEVPGENLLDKIEKIKEKKDNLERKCAASENQVAEVCAEVGENEEKTSPMPRVRALSNSLKKNTSNLKEAVGLLEKKLEGFEGEDCVGKVDSLMEEMEHALNTINVLGQKLLGIPGDDLLQKLEFFQEELKLGKAALEEERKLTTEARAALLDAQQDAQDKEQTYSDLYIELLNARSQVDDLDKQLSEAQVENFKNKEKFNDLLSKQFQSS